MIIASTYKDGKRATLHAELIKENNAVLFSVTHTTRQSYNIFDFQTLEEAYTNYKKLSFDIEK